MIISEIMNNSKNMLNDSQPNKIAFIDLKREWSFFETDFLKAFEEFGRAGIYVLGPDTEKFEANFTSYHKYKYGVSVATGLAALEISLLAHGITAGDEVITVPNSAVATSLAISNIGAKVIFCDVKENYLIDEEKISALITPKTKAILPVHLFGTICNISAINEIAKKNKLIVIEDACQAHGANFTGDSLINTKAFSFYPTKNLGALGEGGLILTNDEKIKDFAVSYRDYGQKGRYNHVMRGDNNRMSALQCRLLDLKLKKLDSFIETRRSIAKKYITELANLKGLKINEYDNNSSYHLFVIRVLNNKRDALKAYLAKNNIDTLIHYPTTIPNQPCYLNDYPDLNLNNTDLLQTEILSLPCYPFLETSEQDVIIKKIKAFFN